MEGKKIDYRTSGKLLINNYNAMACKKAIEDDVFPFYPDESGIVNTTLAVNMKTNQPFPLKLQTILKVKQAELGSPYSEFVSNLLISEAVKNGVDISVKPDEYGVTAQGVYNKDKGEYEPDIKYYNVAQINGADNLRDYLKNRYIENSLKREQQLKEKYGENAFEIKNKQMPKLPEQRPFDEAIRVTTTDAAAYVAACYEAGKQNKPVVYDVEKLDELKKSLMDSFTIREDENGKKIYKPLYFDFISNVESYLDNTDIYQQKETNLSSINYKYVESIRNVIENDKFPMYLQNEKDIIDTTLPINMKTGKPVGDKSLFILKVRQAELEAPTSEFVTDTILNKAQAAGINVCVKDGEEPYPVILTKKVNDKFENDIIQYYNACQIEGYAELKSYLQKEYEVEVEKRDAENKAKYGERAFTIKNRTLPEYKFNNEEIVRCEYDDAAQIVAAMQEYGKKGNKMCITKGTLDAFKQSMDKYLTVTVDENGKKNYRPFAFDFINKVSGYASCLESKIAPKEKFDSKKKAGLDKAFDEPEASFDIY